MDYFEYQERKHAKSAPAPDVIPWEDIDPGFEIHDTIVVEHGRQLPPGVYPAVLREVKASGHVMDLSWQLAL